MNIFTRATHLSHPQALTGKKWKFSFSPKNTHILNRLNKNSPKWPKIASQTPRNGPHMLKTLQMFDFRHKIIG